MIISGTHAREPVTGLVQAGHGNESGAGVLPVCPEAVKVPHGAYSAFLWDLNSPDWIKDAVALGHGQRAFAGEIVREITGSAL